MPTSTPVFGWPTPDNDTEMVSLGQELVLLAAAIDHTVSQLKLMGDDPSSVLPRVVALEAKARDLETRVKKIENRKVYDEPKGQLNSLPWKTPADGWQWTDPIFVPFPAGMFDRPPAVTTPAVWGDKRLLFAVLTEEPTKDGFTIRVVKKAAEPLASCYISFTATQKAI